MTVRIDLPPVRVVVSPAQFRALEEAILRRGNLSGIGVAGMHAALKESSIDAPQGATEIDVVVDWSRTDLPLDRREDAGASCAP